jgi:hypothetical protein
MSDKTTDIKPIEQVWEMEPTDCIRFVLRRAEWDTLIRALAGAAARARHDTDVTPWDGLDILKTAAVDVPVSEMTHALTMILSFARSGKTHELEMIRMWAERGLKGLEL